MDQLMRGREKPPPVPRREIIRLGFILAGTAAGFFFLFRFQHHDIGGASRLALGTWLTVWGIVDIVSLATGDIDRVWLRTRRGSIISTWCRSVGGLALVLTGLVGIF